MTFMKSLSTATKVFVAAMFVAGVSLVSTAMAAPPGSPYNLGETLQPTCAPGSANCTVVTPAASGANSDITSLSGLTTALSMPQGGTGLSTIPADRLIYSSALDTFSPLGLDAMLSFSGGNLILTDDALTEAKLDVNNAPSDGAFLKWNNATTEFIWGAELDPVWLAAEPNYANLGQAETITADWDNTANPWAANELVSTVMIAGENVSLLANDAGYLTSYTETDPIYGAAPAASITNAGSGLVVTTTERSNWNTAFGWGNHATAGYLTDGDFPSAGVMTTDGSGNYSIVTGPFVLADGTQDLTSDWTIASNSITLTAGTLTAATITDGTFSVNGGAVTGATGNVSMWTNDAGYLTSYTETDPNALKITSNLSDLNNAATARTNLGLGSGDSVSFTDVTVSGLVSIQTSATAPGSPIAGSMYLDTSPTPAALCIYDGSAWVDISTNASPGNCA